MTKTRSVYTLTIYLFSFLLLWEWLRPLSQLTQTGKLHYFVIFIALSLILNFTKIPWWLVFPIKTIIVLYFLHSVFFEEDMGMLSWLAFILKDINKNTAILVSGDWYNFSNLFRSLLFFILLWLMTYLLRYWLTVKNRIFTFYIMTVIYVSVLDTFTIYNGEWAIVRVVIIGFGLLGLLFFKRLLEKEQIYEQNQFIGKWIIPLILMIFISISLGYVSPKAGPIWPDPVPFIQTTVENTVTNGSISTIGYGSDDSQLGGPFIGDDRTVFEVKTPTRQYWRIETKDFYTGKGWTTSQEPNPEGVFYSGDEIISNVASDEQVREAVFEFNIHYSHIVHPYGLQSVNGNEDGFFRYSAVLDKIIAYTHDNQEVKLKEYTVDYKRTAFSMKELRETNSLPHEQPFAAFQKHYTQLPESLPSRVRDLAEQVTGDEDNWFDKAKAVERYLQSGDYSYDQTDVAVPTENKDYVDQFLFETFKGYCDNFSTSMVAMLRAVDIPARWVKGYTAGTYLGSADSQLRKYKITNNEAHSWVEVFFPTQGWVPFEPTRGFDNYASYVQDEEAKESSSVAPNIIRDEREAPQIIEEDQQVNNDSTNAKSNTSEWTGVNAFFSMYWLGISIVLAFVVGVGIWLVWKRRRWMPYYLLMRYRRKNGVETFIHAYGELLKQLNRFGVKRASGQTLRDYAVNIDLLFDTNEMGLLTDHYERVVYGGNVSDSDWEEVRKLWEYLIKRTTG